MRGEQCRIRTGTKEQEIRSKRDSKDTIFFFGAHCTSKV